MNIKDYMVILNIQDTFSDNQDVAIRELVKYFKIESMLYKDSLEFLTKITNFIKDNNHQFIKRFTHNNVEYGFIPNLDEITVGEYLDIDLYQTDKNSVHRLMSVLYRPVINKTRDNYKIESYKGTDKCNIMMDVPAEYFLGAMVFFWNLNKVL